MKPISPKTIENQNPKKIVFAAHFKGEYSSIDDVHNVQNNREVTLEDILESHLLSRLEPHERGMHRRVHPKPCYVERRPKSGTFQFPLEENVRSVCEC